MSSSSPKPSHIPPGDKSRSADRAWRKVDLDGHNLPPSPAPSSPRNGRKYALATEIVFTESNDQHNASSTPIYQVRVTKSVHQTPLHALTYRHSLLHSSKHLPLAAESTTTPDPETQLERI